jgi:hypothetical protein
MSYQSRYGFEAALGGAGSTASELVRRDIAVGGKVIKCPYPLNVIKDTYDHSCY